MKTDSHLKGAYAAAISAVLFSSLVILGWNLGSVMPAHAAAMDDKGDSMMEDKMSGDAMMDKPSGHVLKGQISNVQLGSDGQPEWIQLGIWVLRASFGGNEELQSANFVAKFSMVMPDGTAMHTHKVYGFQPASFMSEQDGAVNALEGTATVTTSSGPVSEVPVTIKVFNRSVIALWIGPDKVNGHFGSDAIYGLLSTGSRNAMSELHSMMKDRDGGMMMDGKLTKTSVPVTIPLSSGYANGHEVFYISTEASDRDLAALMTNWTGSRVVYAPALANTPPSALANIYAFKNGIEGSGPLGFQPNVADSEPGDAGYSPLWRIILVEWAEGSTPVELKSEAEITAALQDGMLTIEPTQMVVNCPFVQWEGGSLKVREDKVLTDSSPYGGGQVLDIDTENLTVTFVAHRGFAPDGSTIYYIATDASSQDVADALGVLFVNRTGATALSGASSDLWVFTNGIEGTGPMGFQASIAGSDVGDTNYSPLWRINAATWNNPASAKFLTTASEITGAVSGGTLKTEIAGFVVNCPFVEVDGA